MILSTACKEILSLHEMLRRLGFTTDEIFVDLVTLHERPHAQVALRLKGKDSEPVFRVDIWEDHTDTARDLEAAMFWWNAQAPNSRQLEAIFKDSTALANALTLIMLLELKGLLKNGKRPLQ